MRIVALALVAGLLLTAPAANAAGAGTSPYVLHGVLQSEPTARANARFFLRARLTPTAGAPLLRAYAVLPSAGLKSVAACPTPGSIFAHGFEGP